MKTTPDPEKDPVGWIQRHIKGLGVGVTAAALATTVTGLELARRRRANLQQYLGQLDLFEYENEAPSKKAMLSRHIAAVCLTRPAGATPRELRQTLHGQPAAHNHLGQQLHCLVGADILTRPDVRTQIVTPHLNFVAAVHEDPNHWEAVLKLAATYDPNFSLDTLRPLTSA